MITDDLQRTRWAWDRQRVLRGDELQRWITLMHTIDSQRPAGLISHLASLEAHTHMRVPFYSDEPSALIDVARHIHCQGYSRYFPNPEYQEYDAAKRTILNADTDSTQARGVLGDAWMCYAKDRPVRREEDIYGLMYEIYPKKVHLYGCPISKRRGWRTLPVGKLFRPADTPSPLSDEGLRLLDELELAGAQFSELSGLSVRPSAAADGGVIFHEIMRRIVHLAIIMAADGGPTNVLVFAIVEQTRNRIRTRMGRSNFVPLGKSFPPPGKDVDKKTLLAPSIIEPIHFLDRLVTSYRDAQRAGRALKVLVEGIRHYTRGLAWRYLRLSPDMIELLQELDVSTPGEIARTAENGWHDRCGENTDCLVCNMPQYQMVRVSDITHARRIDPRTNAA